MSHPVMKRLNVPLLPEILFIDYRDKVTHTKDRDNLQWLDR